jgi:hypothetical protein
MAVIEIAITCDGGKFTDSAVFTTERELVNASGAMLAVLIESWKTSEAHLAGCPVWQDYDVIIVDLGKKYGQSYTYIRKGGEWPGEHHWSTLTDQRVSHLWAQGRVAHVIRDGSPLPMPLKKVEQP